ncbi:MAG: efflux RND transporter permease subunit [Spirochaetales bacterium]|nr:efflux RND transporter permease subunit [Spirochaetales bacterium]
MKISRFAVMHPAIVIISMVSLLIFSVLSFLSTPVSFIPDVNMPMYNVISLYPGADADRVNDEVSIPLEKQLATLSGLDSGRMEALNLSVLGVSRIIGSNNRSLPAGSVQYRGKSLVLETAGDFRSLDDLNRLIVGSRAGSPIFLGDVADIELLPPVENSLLMADGEETILFKMYRRDGEDVLKIIKEAKEILSGLAEERTDVDAFNYIQDESRVTFNAVWSISKSLLLGIVLAFAVIFLFLKNIRFALYISVSLPLSILFSMIGLKLAGLSLNLLSLAGLTVAIGMVVDASIVIMENIHKHMSEGLDKKTASINGAMEMGNAVLASALTTISVFLPMLFLKGIVGIFFGNIAVTIILSLTASLIVSLIVVPFLSAHLPGTAREKEHNWLDKLSDLYRSGLEKMLDKKSFIFTFAAAVLIISGLSLQTLGMNVFPSLDTGEIEIHLEYPAGYTLEKSRNKTEEIEKIIRDRVEGIETMFFEISPGRATGSVLLVQADRREQSTHEINKILTTEINSNVTDVKALFFNGGLDTLITYATGGRGYIVDLYSPDFEELELASETVENIIRQDPSVYYVDNSAGADNMKLKFVIDPNRIGQLGLSTYEAAATGTVLYLGDTVGSYRDGGVIRDITLISDLHEQPLTPDSMNRMHLLNSMGSTISYSSFSEMETERTPGSVSRENRLYHASITGYYFGEDVTAIDKRMNSKLEEMAFPSTITRGTGGTAGMLEDELPGMITVLLIALFLVYAVMVIQFEKFRQPFIIIAAYPFSLIGLVFGLNVFGSVLSFIAFLGLIALSGVVVNNAIILVDYTNLLRRERDMGIREALLESAGSRLQPILMTTLTTMLGVLPMALGRGNGAEMYAPLGQVILGGMLTSTFITLFFIPALYELLETKKRRS